MFWKKKELDTPKEDSFDIINISYKEKEYELRTKIEAGKAELKALEEILDNTDANPISYTHTLMSLKGKIAYLEEELVIIKENQTPEG